MSDKVLNINFIVGNNTVNGKPIYYFQDDTSIVLPENAGQILLMNCTNIRGSNILLYEANRTSLFCFGVVDLQLEDSSFSHSRINNQIIANNISKPQSSKCGTRCYRCVMNSRNVSNSSISFTCELRKGFCARFPLDYRHRRHFFFTD